MFHDMLTHSEQLMTTLDPIASGRMPPPQGWPALFKGTNTSRTPVLPPLGATVDKVSAAGIMDPPTSQPRPQLSRFLSVNMRFPARCVRFTCGLFKKIFRLPLHQHLDRTSLVHSAEMREPADSECGPQVDLFSEKSLPFDASKCLTMAHPVASSPEKPYCAEYLTTAFRDCASFAWKPKVHWSEPLVTAVHDCPPASPSVHWGEPLITAIHECPSTRPRVYWGEPLVTAVHDALPEWPTVRWSDPLITAAHDYPPEYYVTPDSRPPMLLGHPSMTASEHVRWAQSSGAEIDVDGFDEDDEGEARDEGFCDNDRGADFVFERFWTM